VYYPQSTELSKFTKEERDMHLKFLKFSKSEIEFAYNFFDKLDENEEYLEINDDDPEDMPATRDFFMKDVISEMQREKSILRPFTRVTGRLSYERLISLMDYCSKNLQITGMDKFRTCRCVLFLQNAPNVSADALNLIFGYYIHHLNSYRHNAIKIIKGLSDKDRMRLKRLQTNPQIISGISDPNCQGETKILQSLLEVGVFGKYELPYALAMFSLSYFQNPERSVQFFDDLKKEAKEDKLLQKVLNASVCGPTFESITFTKHLEGYSEDDKLFALFYLWLDETPRTERYFLNELVKIFLYPEFDLYLFRSYFETDKAFRKFLIDLNTAKNEGPLGFENIWPLFPVEEVWRLKEIFSHKRNFYKWLHLFISLFQTHIINMKPPPPKIK
jgi:hypothetical protein